MTQNEAINGLKNLFSEHELTLSCTDSLEIMNMAVAALEKQIPKKVIIAKSRNEKEKFARGDYVKYRCPDCDYEIGSAFYYPPNEYMREHVFCEKCGQLLDWSEA